jgi:hypothetical protein
MKRFFIYALLLLLAQPLYATSIIVLITPGYIVMGADSKRMIIDAESNVTQNQSVCKIRKANNYCYAIAGLVASRSTSFSADSIVHQQLKITADYDKAIKGIKKEIKKALQKELVYQKQHQPLSFQKMLQSKEHILEVVILSVKDNVPHVQIVGFELSDDQSIEVKAYTASCPGDCPETNVQLYFLGEYSGMENYLSQQHRNSDPVSLVEQLITLQSKATPSSVGAPINIVKYTSDGVEWIK